MRPPLETIKSHAEAGDATAQYVLGTHYVWDASRAKTDEQESALEEQAVRLFEQASAQGMVAASVELLTRRLSVLWHLPLPLMEPASWSPPSEKDRGRTR